MTTYKVFYNGGLNQATIALEGYEPTVNEGAEIGTFEMDVNPINQQTTASEISSSSRDPNTGFSGDHPFIVRARDLLADSDQFKGTDVRSVVFVDKASNAPVHNEDAREDHLGAEEGSDPDFSNQRGGEGSTEGTDPATTEANGQTPATERPEGEGSQDGQTGQEANEYQQTRDPLDHDNDGRKGGSVPSGDETVEQLKTRIAGITDKDELQKVYDAENARQGGSRSTAISAIEARATELEAA